MNEWMQSIIVVEVNGSNLFDCMQSATCSVNMQQMTMVVVVILCMLARVMQQPTSAKMQYTKAPKILEKNNVVVQS